MKRTILTGVLAVTAGLSCLLAQTPPPAAPKGTTVKSKEEQQAIVAIQKATDPDSQIAASEGLLTKFADTEYKEFALSVEARAYQSKRDDVQAQVYAERALQINPKAFLMELLVAEVVSRKIGLNDLDRNDKIAKCTKYFNDAIELAKVATKPNAQTSDADFLANQKFVIAEAHDGLGTLLGNVEKKWDDAIKEYQLAVDGDPEQWAYSVRLAQAYLSAGKYPEAIAVCDKVLKVADIHPMIKQAATNIKNAAAARK